MPGLPKLIDAQMPHSDYSQHAMNLIVREEGGRGIL
jgi:hypothetical protein